MDLLEYVAKNAVPSIRQLARQLARDYRNVYDDVQRLVQLGLIEIEAGGSARCQKRCGTHKMICFAN